MKPQFRDVRDRLRYVKTEREDYDLSSFPDFMAIGPQRTGTTWLGNAIKYHPQVFIPWQKEVHYFNNLEYPEYHPASLPPISQELGWYLDMFKVPDPDPDRNEEQVQRRFGHSFRPTCSGDFTATYAAALHDGIIEDLVTLNPDVKIIVLVRDPVRRAWSHAYKDLCTQRKRAIDEVPEEEWLAFFHQEYQINCGNYSEWLERWKQKVPAKNLMVGRFSDVKNDPRKLVATAYEFLGLEVHDKYFSPDLGVREAGLAPGISAKATKSSDIPPKLLAELERLFGEETTRLRDLEMI